MLGAFYVHCERSSDIAAARDAILFQDDGASISPIFSDALAVLTEMSRSEILRTLNTAPLSGRCAVFVGKTKPGYSVLEVFTPKA